MIPYETKSGQHYIEPSTLTFTENYQNYADIVKVSIAYGAAIMVYVQGEPMLRYGANLDYKRWSLSGVDVKLNDDGSDKQFNIYARLSRTEQKAFIIFSLKDYDLYGSYTDENGQKTENSEDYWYIKIGYLTAPVEGVRTLYYDSGQLGTRKGEAEKSEMFELISTNEPKLIRPLFSFESLKVCGEAVFKSTAKFLGNILMFDRTITGISPDEAEGAVSTEEQSNSELVTPRYVQSHGDQRYLNKLTEESQSVEGDVTFLADLSTEGNVKVGGSLSVDGAATIKDRLTIGDFQEEGDIIQGANVTKDGVASFAKVKTPSLQVYELIYNRKTAVQGEFVFSDGDTIESVTYVTSEGNRYTSEQVSKGEFAPYTGATANFAYIAIGIKQPYDGYISTMHEDDILYSNVNNIGASGESATTGKCFMRIAKKDEIKDEFGNSVSPIINETDIDGVVVSITFNVLHYAPDENIVPAGVNMLPQPHMTITRHGNETNDERQDLFLISSEDGRISYLTGVNSPIITTSNYAQIVGKLPPSLADEVYKNAGYLAKNQPYYFGRGAIIQDLIMLDYKGEVSKLQKFRGEWLDSVASSATDYYRSTDSWYDVVTYKGSTWACNVGKAESFPGGKAGEWILLVAAGTDSVFNMLNNTNFESIVDGKYTDWISVVGNVTTKYQGYNVLTRTSSTNDVFLKAETPSLQSNKWYTLSFLYRNEGTEKFSLNVTLLDKFNKDDINSTDGSGWVNTAETSTAVYFNLTGGEWREAYIIFKYSGEESKPLGFQFYKPSSTTFVEITQIKLEAGTAATQYSFSLADLKGKDGDSFNANLLDNSTFRKLSQSWDRFDTRFGGVDAGVFSSKFTPDNNEQRIDVLVQSVTTKLSPSTWYTLSFDMRGWGDPKNSTGVSYGKTFPISTLIGDRTSGKNVVDDGKSLWIDGIERAAEEGVGDFITPNLGSIPWNTELNTSDAYAASDKSWKRRTFTFCTLPSISEDAIFTVRQWNKGYFEIKNIKLEEGKKATSWCISEGDKVEAPSGANIIQNSNFSIFNEDGKLSDWVYYDNPNTTIKEKDFNGQNAFSSKSSTSQVMLKSFPAGLQGNMKYTFSCFIKNKQYADTLKLVIGDVKGLVVTCDNGEVQYYTAGGFDTASVYIKTTIDYYTKVEVHISASDYSGFYFYFMNINAGDFSISMPKLEMGGVATKYTQATSELTGPRGYAGSSLYPAGTWDINTTYKIENNCVPFVWYVPEGAEKGAYYVLTSPSSTGDYPNMQTHWRVFEYFQYLFAEFLMAKWATFGTDKGGVFYDKYLFSQYGVDKDGKYGRYPKTMFDENENLTKEFTPSLYVNFYDGEIKTNKLSETFQEFNDTCAMEIKKNQSYNVKVPSSDNVPKLLCMPQYLDTTITVGRETKLIARKQDWEPDGMRSTVLVKADRNWERRMRATLEGWIGAAYENVKFNSTLDALSSCLLLSADPRCYSPFSFGYDPNSGRVYQDISEIHNGTYDGYGGFVVGGVYTDVILIEPGQNIMLRSCEEEDGRVLWYVENSEDFEEFPLRVNTQLNQMVNVNTKDGIELIDTSEVGYDYSHGYETFDYGYKRRTFASKSICRLRELKQTGVIHANIYTTNKMPIVNDAYYINDDGTVDYDWTGGVMNISYDVKSIFE